jgi:hypothetical protein
METRRDIKVSSIDGLSTSSSTKFPVLINPWFLAGTFLILVIGASQFLTD